MAIINGASEQVQAAVEAGGHHGADLRGLASVPQSPLFEGRFGRMFRSLPALDPGIDAINALASLMEQSGESASGDNTTIPAGYTYFGQFVDHDITFDPMSVLQKQNAPDALVDFRTPRLDLDSVYGSGPADQPYLYDASGVKFEIDPIDDNAAEPDMTRSTSGPALIGDPRNDVNLIGSKLHVLFCRAHNKLIDFLVSA